MISRLTWQKGMDLLLESLPAIDRARAQLVVVGSGDKALEGVHRRDAQPRRPDGNADRL